ncbi:MAG: zinc-binding alcohol dehydrogenase family protein [Acidimicrobiia bacterium]|nr:zinc-binding alcohol dehydrogenase family protein [Acidimicrobiia bacterium]
MKAALLVTHGPLGEGPLRLTEVVDPEPGPGELLLAIDACGVCRTDLQIVEGDLPVRTSPVVPGHQIVGTVLALGPDVTGWNEGDRAGVGWMAGTCGQCPFCIGGRENLCERARFTGWDRHGGFAERTTVDASFAFALPMDPPASDLAPLLCGGVIGYRALKLSGIQPGGTLGLFGFGASALLAMQLASYWGCEVFVVTRSETQRRRAIEMGAVWAGSYEETVPVRLDATVTFAPAGEAVVAALSALAPGGIVAVNAIHLDRIPEFDYGLLWQERHIRSVANFTRADAVEFLELATTIPIRTVADVFPLDAANQALTAVKDGTAVGAAVLETR